MPGNVGLLDLDAWEAEFSNKFTVFSFTDRFSVPASTKKLLVMTG